MGDGPITVSEETARTLVQFLHDSEGTYALKFPGRVGALPYYRAAEYGGFKMKSLVGPDGHVEEGHYGDDEVAEMVAQARAIEVVHRAQTPPEIWGTREGDDTAFVTGDLLEGIRAIRRAVDAMEDDGIAHRISRACAYIEDRMDEYVGRGADGDAEVGSDP